MTLRIFIAGTVLSVVACGTPAAPGPTPESRAPVESPAAPAVAHAPHAHVLDIPARSQAAERPDEGWCAETAIQESMLHFGAYWPQRDINRAGRPRHPDLYWDDVPVALRRLGIRFERWSGDGGQPEFTEWVRSQLADGHPVVAGVKLYPTDHPSWGLDHIVLIVGVEDDDSMLINTTWGYRQRRTRRQLGSEADGISLANRYDRQFAYAITGLKSATEAPSVHLVLERESTDDIEAIVRVGELERGRRYQLRRFDASGELVESHGFEATAKSGSFRVTLAADATARFDVARANR